MNIVFLKDTFDPESRESTNVTTRDLSLELVKREHSVYIICGQKKGQKLDENYEGINVTRIKTKKYIKTKYKRFRKYFLDIPRLYDRIFLHRKGLKKIGMLKDPIIVNICAAPALGLRTLIIKLTGYKARYVAVLRSLSAKARYPFSPGSYLYSFLLKHNDMIITPLQKIKNKLISMGIKKERISVIRSYIGTNKFKPKKGRRVGDKKMVLYFGHFSKNKGVGYLIDSFKYWGKDEDRTLVLVPSGPEQLWKFEDVVKKAENSILSDRIRIEDPNVDIIDYINSADAVVFPYPHLISTEGNPLSLIETMACRTPVVTTDLEELREIVKKDEHVLMARPKDPKDLAKEIDRILSDKELGKKLVRNAYEKSKEFDVKKIAREYEEVFRGLLFSEREQ